MTSVCIYLVSRQSPHAAWMVSVKLEGEGEGLSDMRPKG